MIPAALVVWTMFPWMMTAISPVVVKMLYFGVQELFLFWHSLELCLDWVCLSYIEFSVFLLHVCNWVLFDQARNVIKFIAVHKKSIYMVWLEILLSLHVKKLFICATVEYGHSSVFHDHLFLDISTGFLEQFKLKQIF